MNKELRFYTAASGDVCVTVIEYGKDDKHFNLGKDAKNIFDFLNCEEHQGTTEYE